MTTWINYHHLFYFKTIAEEGSVSKAAQKLRIGQPSLSAQLKILEDSLGVQLFERHHKKLVLTEQGKVALEYSKTIFKMGSEMYEVLHDRMMPQRLTLHLGSLDSIPKQIILKLAQSAYKIAPCQISLSEGKSDELIRELSAHKIDLVVTNFLPTIPESKGLFPKNITRTIVAIYGAPKFKNLKKDFPRSISKSPMILPTYDSKLRYDLDHWAKVHNVGFNVIAETQDIGMKKLMAINGLGLIPTATHTVARQVASGELIEVGRLQGVYEELYLLSAQRKIANPIAAKLMSSFVV